MNPANHSARAFSTALALSLLLQPTLGWSQRAMEAPIALPQMGTPGFVGPNNSIVSPGASALAPVAGLSLSAGNIGAVKTNPLSLPAAASRQPGPPAGKAAAGTVAALRLAPSQARAMPGAEARREAPGTLGALAVGAREVAAAVPTDGVGQAVVHIFDGGMSRDRKVAANGAGDDSPAPGAGGQAPNGAGSRGSDLPHRMPILRMEQPLFPGTRTRFFPGHEASVAMVADAAAGANGRYLLIATNRTDGSGLFPVASVVRVVDYQATPKGDAAMFEVVSEAVIENVGADAQGKTFAVVHYQGKQASDPKEARAMLKVVQDLTREVGRLNSDIDTRLLQAVLQGSDPDNVATVLASEMPFPVAVKQSILAARSTTDRLRIISRALTDIKTEGQITQRTHEDLNKNQKEYVLRQKMKAIKKELGDEEEGGELEALKAKVEAAGMPEAVQSKALKELKKLEGTNPQSSEYTVGRNYVDWLVSVPWDQRTVDNIDLQRAREILDRDHFGLESVKRRVLEVLAVRKRTGTKKGAIIVFDGPPGTGKTSIAHSIAEAMGRKYVRFSAGGVRDEAEIRGHRRTYVGAMPGTIIQKMKEAGTVNPVMVIDEGDKIGQESQTGGNPAAAMLEVLDPEQNGSFRDHYLDVPYDLSEVLFIVTSNELFKLPEALRDRMDLIQFSAYTDQEKLNIAQKHIVAEKFAANGLTGEQATFSPAALLRLIRGWTHEAGVRSLKREIDNVARKIVTLMDIEGMKAPGEIRPEQLETYLGSQRYDERQTAVNDVGVATGLSVSGHGGDTLNVEVTATPGNGALNLRKQMLEMTDDSAHNVVTYIKHVAARYGVSPVWFREHNIDINFTPAGKIDGPSAGTAMATALLSEATGRKVKEGIAMTGEITSKGRVLPIGGLKEKVLAAHRMGYHTVLFPIGNSKDLEKIPDEIKQSIKLLPMSRAEEVFAIALEDAPAAEAPSAASTLIDRALKLLRIRR